MDEFKEVIAPFTNPLVIIALMVAMSLGAQIQVKLINIQVPVRAYWAYLSETENQPLLIKALSNISIICLLVLYISIIICFFWRLNNVHNAHKSSDAQARSRLEKEISRLLKKSGYWRKQAARVSGLEKLLAERNASLKQIRIELEELKLRKSRSGYSTRPAQHTRKRLAPAPAPSLDDTEYYGPHSSGCEHKSMVRSTIQLLRTSRDTLVKNQEHELEELRRNVSEYQTQILDLQRQIAEDAELSETETITPNQPKAADDNEQRLQAELILLRGQLERAHSDLNKHKSEAAKAQKENKRTVATFRSQESELSEIKEKHDALATKNRALVVEYQKLIGMSMAESTRAGKKLESKENELIEARSKYNAILIGQETIMATPTKPLINISPNIVADFSEDLAKAQGEIQQLRDKLDETERTKHEKLAELRNEKDDADNVAKSLRKQLAAKENELSVLAHKPSDSEQQLPDTTKELLTCQQQLTQKNGEVTDSKARLTEKEEELSRYKTAAEREVQKGLQRIATQNDEISHKDGQISEKDGVISRLQGQLADQKATSYTDEQLRQADHRYTEMQRQSKELHGKIASLRGFFESM